MRDVISGFFLILEDQVRVGDIARINGVSGVVEQINLRTIVLRDARRGRAGVSERHRHRAREPEQAVRLRDRRRAGAVQRKPGPRVRDDSGGGRVDAGRSGWAPLLLAPIEILGVESIADGRATIRSKFKTLPLNQGRVANELRRRLLGALAGRGIRPYAS